MALEGRPSTCSPVITCLQRLTRGIWKGLNEMVTFFDYDNVPPSMLGCSLLDHDRASHHQSESKRA